MKIRNKFLIPLIALILAVVMAGASVSGTAADTTASESASESTTHPLTYIPPTMPPTSSMDEMIDEIISENLGDLADSEEDVRELGGAMGNILRVFRDFINDLLAITAKIGEFLSGNWLGIYTPQSK